MSIVLAGKRAQHAALFFPLKNTEISNKTPERTPNGRVDLALAPFNGVTQHTNYLFSGHRFEIHIGHNQLRRNQSRDSHHGQQWFVDSHSFLSGYGWKNPPCECALRGDCCVAENHCIHLVKPLSLRSPQSGLPYSLESQWGTPEHQRYWNGGGGGRGEYECPFYFSPGSPGFSENLFIHLQQNKNVIGVRLRNVFAPSLPSALRPE